MRISIQSKLKPLYANLLKLDIAAYLTSQNFAYLCIENNVDDLWSHSTDYVMHLNSVVIYDPKDNTAEALGVFLYNLFNRGREQFILIVGKIILDFRPWKNRSKDFTEVRKNILDLGYREDEISWIFPKNRKKSIDAELSISQEIAKRPELKKIIEQIDILFQKGSDLTLLLDIQNFMEWKTQSLNFLVNHLGYNSVYTQSFTEQVRAVHVLYVEYGQGILKAVREDILNDRILVHPIPDDVKQLISSRTIFIIHGHDATNTLRLEKLLRDRFHLIPLILSDKPGKGRTLIEKFEQEAREAAYAMALFTPDDFIEVSGTKYTQSRPNVIFEIGWFYGRLGRQNVCILFKKGTKIPSDLEGINRIEFNDSIEEKIIDIENELIVAGLIESEEKS